MERQIDKTLASDRISDMMVRDFRAARLDEVEQALAREALLEASRPSDNVITRILRMLGFGRQER